MDIYSCFILAMEIFGNKWKHNENQPHRLTYERILKQILHYKPKGCRNWGRPWKRWNEYVKSEQTWLPIPVVPKLVGMTEVVHVEIMGILQNWTTNWRNSLYTYHIKSIKAIHWAIIMPTRCLKIRQSVNLSVILVIFSEPDPGTLLMNIVVIVGSLNRDKEMQNVHVSALIITNYCDLTVHCAFV
jgi:hypothetical protein